MAKHSSDATNAHGNSGYQGRHRAEDGGRHDERTPDGKIVGWSAGREPRAPDNYNR